MINETTIERIICSSFKISPMANLERTMNEIKESELSFPFVISYKNLFKDSYVVFPKGLFDKTLGKFNPNEISIVWDGGSKLSSLWAYSFGDFSDIEGSMKWLLSKTVNIGRLHFVANKDKAAMAISLDSFN